MYRRLKNRLDVELMKESILQDGIDKEIVERVEAIIDILDDSYGKERSSKAMGGYVFLFRNKTDYDISIDKIMIFHHINVNEYEYSDIIHEDWQEELYLLSSDDALVIVHPNGAK